MQQTPNIVKIEDDDCNQLTVEAASDENIKKTNLKEKENNKMTKLKNVKKRKKTWKWSWG